MDKIVQRTPETLHCSESYFQIFNFTSRLTNLRRSTTSNCIHFTFISFTMKKSSSKPVMTFPGILISKIYLLYVAKMDAFFKVRSNYNLPSSYRLELNTNYSDISLNDKASYVNFVDASMIHLHWKRCVKSENMPKLRKGTIHQMQFDGVIFFITVLTIYLYTQN